MKWIISLFTGKAGLSIIALVVGIGGSYLWFQGYMSGSEGVAERLTAKYEAHLQDQSEKWSEAVSGRDEEWQAAVRQRQEELMQRIQQFKENEQREQELLDRLNVLQEQLEEINNEASTSDLGTCALSPDFDGLLQRQYQATERPEPPPD